MNQIARHLNEWYTPYFKLKAMLAQNNPYALKEHIRKKKQFADIEVGERKMVNGQDVREIKIYHNFVGYVEV